MHNQPHPDLEMLDRLRAGLLDDRPDERSALEQHIAGCETCRRLHLDGWQQLGPSALGPRLDTASLAGELQAARRRALNSPRQHRLFRTASITCKPRVHSVARWRFSRPSP